jgi:hypothetical protein
MTALRRGLGLVAVAAMLASCSNAGSTVLSETTATYAPLAPLSTTSSLVTTSSTTTTSSSTTEPSVATASPVASVEDVMAFLGEFATDWNENNRRWIAALSDPTESHEGFVVVQEEVGAAQGDLLADLDLWIGTLDPEIRPALDPLVEVYRVRYRHMVDELFPATLGGAYDAFEPALREHESHALPEYSEEAVRSFLGHPAVASALSSEDIDPGEAFDSLMQTIVGS